MKEKKLKILKKFKNLKKKLKTLKFSMNRLLFRVSYVLLTEGPLNLYFAQKLLRKAKFARGG